MKFSAEREAILGPLQAVIGVVERRQTMPVLSNVLLTTKNNLLAVTATDLEVELVAATTIAPQVGFDVTIPGRKFVDIIRALPEHAAVNFSLEGERAVIKSGKSKFVLSTLPASDFPTVEDIQAQQTIRIAQRDLKRLIDKTHFAMGQQDVRYYLNGMLIELSEGDLRAVATDGHRLALCQVKVAVEGESSQQVIVPRKGVLELQKLLKDDGELSMSVGTNHIRAEVGTIRMTSKLIDGRFPEYSRVIPVNPPKIVKSNRELLRVALHRAAILSNEKYRGIRLVLKSQSLFLQAHNPEQEEAEEELEVAYEGDDLEIGFNVNYLLDALAAVEGSDVEIALTDSNNSCVIRAPSVQDSTYVVMPMRL